MWAEWSETLRIKQILVFEFPLRFDPIKNKQCGGHFIDTKQGSRALILYCRQGRCFTASVFKLDNKEYIIRPLAALI
jgi:hypothetical protein